MKYCKKCGREYPGSLNFCEECGSRLVKFIEEIRKPKLKETMQPKKYPRWQWAILGIVCIIILFFFVGSWWTASFVRTRTETMETGTRCREVQEPYTVQVPYSYTYKYSVVDAKLERLWNSELGDYSKGTVKVANLEDMGGTFTVKYTFKTVGETIPKISSKWISAHSTQTFEFIYDSKIGQDVVGSYSVTPATTTKYRTETRYRTVTKCD